MVELKLYPTGKSREEIAQLRRGRALALTVNERIHTAFELMNISLAFKKGPIKLPKGKGIILEAKPYQNSMEEETLGLFRLLFQHDVKYILVGGLAVNHYGYSRTTGDIDLWLEDTVTNRQNLVNALLEMGVMGSEAFLEHPLIAGFSEILLGNGIYIDMMSSLQFFSSENFNECYEKANTWMLDKKTSLKVLHINQLIAEKEQSKRPKDQDDAVELKKLRALK
jgi:hypothetical protein